MARCCGTIYKPIQGTNNQNICHNSNLWYSLGTSIRWLYYWRFFGKHHTGDHLRRSSCSIFRYRDEVVGSSGRVHLTKDFCFINLNPWPIYKWVSRVGFASCVRFCHPFIYIYIYIYIYFHWLDFILFFNVSLLAPNGMTFFFFFLKK